MARKLFLRLDQSSLQPTDVTAIVGSSAVSAVDSAENCFQFAFAAVEVTPEELQMARTLVTASTADFNLEKYADLYTRKLHELIEAKVAGKELVTPPATAGPQVINLMEALKQSVARVQGTNGTKKEPRKATRRLVHKIS